MTRSRKSDFCIFQFLKCVSAKICSNRHRDGTEDVDTLIFDQNHFKNAKIIKITKNRVLSRKALKSLKITKMAFCQKLTCRKAGAIHATDVRK